MDQIARAVMLAAALVAMATLVGVFTYRISQLEFLSAETVMDAVFREQLPSELTFVSASIGGIVFALAFYSHPQTKRRFTYFVAGVVAIAGFDLVLFNLTPQDLVAMNIDFYPYWEALCAQGATALITLLMVPLHRKLAPMSLVPRGNHLPFIANLLGWTRLGFISLLLVLFVVHLSTYKLPPALNKPRLVAISLGFSDIALTLPVMGSLASAIAMASIAYWPPKFRQVKWHFGILRLLLVVLCLMSVGLMYRGVNDSESFLNVVMVTCFTMLIAVPVQRALS